MAAAQDEPPAAAAPETEEKMNDEEGVAAEENAGDASAGAVGDEKEEEEEEEKEGELDDEEEEESDDESEADDLEWNIGFADNECPPGELVRQHFPCKLGGRPAWLNPVVGLAPRVRPFTSRRAINTPVDDSRCVPCNQPDTPGVTT
jgi:hypothetical protein